MPISESMVQDIVQEVMAKMQIADAPTGKHGIFKDMNDAIEAAKKSELIVKKMSMDQREKIITCIRKKIKENAEIMARMGVDETGMGNVGDKILKHHLVADKTPGTEDITTTAWSGDRGLTLIEMGPFGVIGAITPCTNPSETILCNTMGMLAGGNTVVFNPHPAAIKSFIRENDVNIEMRGFVPNNEALKIIANSKALVLPTQWYEGFPMSIVEAFSVGTPVICSDLGNAGSVVEEGITGYKFTADLVDEIIQAVKRCHGLCSQTKKVYKDNYSVEKNYELISSIYKAIQMKGL